MGSATEDNSLWSTYDACSIVSTATPGKFDDILVDVGTDDNFLKSGQLLPEVRTQVRPYICRIEEPFYHLIRIECMKKKQNFLWKGEMESQGNCLEYAKHKYVALCLSRFISINQSIYSFLCFSFSVSHTFWSTLKWR